MIYFQNGGRLLQSPSELPEEWIGADNIYLDFETTSGNSDLMSVNPWRNCKVAGFGLTVDTCDYALYVDYMRATPDEQYLYRDYLQRILWYAQFWINHNVKYDAHVACNDLQIAIPPWLNLKCTLTRAKLIDSDRGGARGGYGLDALAHSWLGRDINHFEDRLKQSLGSSKDYGDAPPDILGEYCCEDVLTNRPLDDYIDARLPDRCQQVALTEMRLTSELVKLERRGLRFNITDLAKAQFATLNRMSKLDRELTEIVGRSFRPSVNKDCNEILCGQYGLPVLVHTKEAVDLEPGEVPNASFDNDALKMYEALPYAPQNVIGRIIEYRELSQRNSLFFTPLQEKMVVEDSLHALIHANYNQIVRTGRMSCSDPNAQQMDDFIRSLIIPPPGWSMISTDASQIEFRLMMHYIQDQVAIAAYTNDPNTDFYLLVAKRVGISRSAAKTLALATGYGEGKKKLIKQLTANKDIILAVKAEIEALGISNEQMRNAEFNARVTKRAENAYNSFHKMFSTLKATTKSAEQTCKLPDRRLGTGLDVDHYYGYITNLYGRDRHLPYYNKYRTDFKTPDPYDKAWLAFSTLNQATAADLLKERFCALCAAIGDLQIYPIGLIHDEILMIAPTEIAEDFRTQRDIVAILEAPAVPISVPIRFSIGTSRLNWLEAKTPAKDGGPSHVLEYNKAEATNFGFLKC